MCERVEIPVRLFSSDLTVKWVSGVDTITTCRDVLEAVFLSDARCRSRDVDEYVLMEQWRGVEKALSPESKILGIWSSWSHEQNNVQFVVKRIKSRNVNNPGNSSKRRPLRRRRNSTSSTTSRTSDTLHPKKIAASGTPNMEELNKHIEDMMKSIMDQSQLLCSELSRMNDSPKATAPSVQPSTSPVLGKEQDKSLSPAPTDLLDFKLELRKIRSLSLEFARLHALNEELHSVETKCHILDSNVVQLQSFQKEQNLIEEKRANRLDTEIQGLETDLVRYKACNEKLMQEITKNKELNHDLEMLTKEKREMVKRLEYDVNVIEKEGRKMSKEYDKVQQLKIPPSQPDDEQSMSLADSHVIYCELKELQKQFQIQSLDKRPGISEPHRILTTGSPEGSSSGVSSGSESNQLDISASSIESQRPLRELIGQKVDELMKKVTKPSNLAADSDTGLGSDDDDGTLV